MQQDRAIARKRNRKTPPERAKRGSRASQGDGPDPMESRWARKDPDVRLMIRFQRGDREAFEKLVRRNTHKVHALVYRFLRDAGQVEDITQEVFMRIYRTAKRYKPRAKFSTWLYRITANLSFNVLRKRKKTHTVPLEITADETGDTYHWELADDTYDPPETDLDSDELRKRVVEAVERLPENQKIAIILNKYEHKSYEEISDVLDVSPQAVKSLLSRARSNLRSYLRHYTE